MNRLYLLFIRCFKSPYVLSVIFSVLFFVFYTFNNIALCEAPSLPSDEIEILNNFRQELYLNIKDMIAHPDFIDRYGRHRYNPQFLTFYYTQRICSQGYIQEFLSNLPLKEILYNKRSEGREYINAYVFALFTEYVEKNHDSFQHLVGSFFPKFAVKIVTNHLKTLHEALKIMDDVYPRTLGSIPIVTTDYIINLQQSFPYKAGVYLIIDGEGCRLSVSFNMNVWLLDESFLRKLIKRI